MAGYEIIRGKIVENPTPPGDGAGAKGPIGSFNHWGGKELVISYKVDNTPPTFEEHHIVPYLIGEARDKSGASVKVLLAWKYKTDSSTHPGLGFRCYKVDKITLPSPTPTPDTRPLLGSGDDDRKKVKLKKQSCVDDW
jgi:hypothetical protein